MAAVLYITLVIFAIMVFVHVESHVWKLLLLGSVGGLWYWKGFYVAISVAAVLTIFIFLKSKMPSVSKF